MLEIDLYQCGCEIACIYHVFITYYYSDTWPLEKKYMGLSHTLSTMCWSIITLTKAVAR